MTFEDYCESRIAQLNAYIDSSLKKTSDSVSQRFGPLIEAMRYTLDGGGKRLRPLLTIASAESLGIESERILPAACAIEFIHTYSLIHDDLPALDDDDIRRGKPSSHKHFGEAVALLAGDALLTEAFHQVLALQEKGFNPSQVLGVIQLLSTHAGVGGMVGGQLLDVTVNVPNCTLPELEFIHIHKTGALIVASVLIPTKLLPLEEEKIQRVRRYGEAIGLAFQISDDLLDSKAEIRYSRGPRKKPKPSYLRMMDPKEVREKLETLTETAKHSIQMCGGNTGPLTQIADYIRMRKK